MRFFYLEILAALWLHEIQNVFGSDNNPMIFTSSDCTLHEPLYGHQFDFTQLHSDLAHLTFSNLGDLFRFNLCGNLTTPCRGIHNTAACLIRQNGKELILGIQHILNYRNGKMYYHFTHGDICPMSKNNETYQLFVFLSCDYTLDRKMSTVTSYSSNACTFYINFETPAACLPEPPIQSINNTDGHQCSVKDPKTGHTYDFISLSDTNYRTSDRQGNAFVMNICKPVLYGENAMCPPNSSVCFINLKSTDYKQRFFDYGRTGGQLVIDNGQLMLRHTSLTRCNDSANYSSTIYFYCDKDVKNAHPELMGFHGCLYEFSFATPLACNDLAPCTAVTHDNEILDLSSLKDKSFKLQQDKQYYKISVCSHPGEPCLESDGACLMVDGQSTSLGRANDHLRINQTGTPYLLYENGANCQMSTNEQTKWSTKIEFICANNSINSSDGSGVNDSSDGSSATNKSKLNGYIALGPKVIENTNCRLLIHFYTNRTCQGEEISCKAKVYVDHSEDGTGMEIIDLTPLISTTENYVADIDLKILNQQTTNITLSTKFFLNVCRPLLPKYGLGCPGGSAACMAIMDKKTGKAENEQGLGFPTVSLSALNRTTAELRYFMGNICPTNQKAHITSTIIFNCNRHAGRGKPKLEEINDCHYQFVWPTNVICPPHLCVFNKDTCEIFNEEMNVKYSLKNAPFVENGKIMVTKEKVNFTLDLCDTHHKAVTDYSQSLVNLFFTSNGPCNAIQNDVINVQMRLICHSINEPSFSFNKCNLLYVQKTPDICKFLGLIPPQNEMTNSTTTTISNKIIIEKSKEKLSTTERSIHHIAAHSDSNTIKMETSTGTVLAIGLSVMSVMICVSLIICSPQRRDKLRQCLRRTTSRVHYVRVNDDEANLLLDHNHGSAESDDDDMIL